MTVDISNISRKFKSFMKEKVSEVELNTINIS